MENNNNAVVQQQNAVGKAEKNISDKVLKSLGEMTDSQGLVLPQGYNPTNALKSAYLKLAESNLLNTDQTALAQALLNMCIQGLTPAKNQCYFINYGGKVNMMRSYHGDRAACIASKLVKNVEAYIIYEGDTVDILYTEAGMEVKHTTNWLNMDKPIKGAYAVAYMNDGTRKYDIMTFDRIKKSWGMSKNQSNNKLQQTFTDDACKRTVIRHLTKNIFNQSTDSNPVIDSYCETTDNEYDYNKPSQETKFDNVVDVHQEQVESNGSQDVDFSGVEDAEDNLFNLGD